MTKRKNYPRLRNGKLEGTGMPPHFIDEKKKEVVFHISWRISSRNGNTDLDASISERLQGCFL